MYSMTHPEDVELEVEHEPTILEVLTPNQKEDKDNLELIKLEQLRISEILTFLLAEMTSVKEHLSIMTGETNIL